MLKELFDGVELPEIVGIDFNKLSHADVTRLLPTFGGEHPTKAILVDTKIGKAFGVASGWDKSTLVHNDIPFRSGALAPTIAMQAGGPWATLGNHVEPVAAAFMRKMEITEATLYINGRNPCWGTPDGTGCYYRMTMFLAEGSTMTVYNKLAENSLASQPDRKFDFTGLPD